MAEKLGEKVSSSYLIDYNTGFLELIIAFWRDGRHGIIILFTVFITPVHQALLLRLPLDLHRPKRHL